MPEHPGEAIAWTPPTPPLRPGGRMNELHSRITGGGTWKPSGYTGANPASVRSSPWVPLDLGRHVEVSIGALLGIGGGSRSESSQRRGPEGIPQLVKGCLYSLDAPVRRTPRTR